ncbi:hypothetical protein Cs7R123_49190 [Catellatospora sp. TT07R-123]|uniref:protein phosphatase 2C domain-containing protein n=1 Tax=Catellatospora sp. TT07R-123 TaxID=2733863 RepID=UPI001B168F0A|nr:protein phosphatase 2C domain-containing protein [Catellatospora sp. TT07R-123]GHJ47577.1 hypothetical protein Cs7R123_49190 [Catellatospora sp. TT07R-123]
MLELSTDAPVIGRVQPPGSGQVSAGGVLRTPSVALDGLVAGRYQVAGASVVGRSHLVAGSCRQDAYAFGLGEDGRLHVAVADGLGSRPTSQVGAALFCQAVMRQALHGPQTTDPRRLIEVAAARTAEQGLAAYGLAERDLRCTVVVAIFADDGVTVARVGDTSAFTLHGGEFGEVFDYDDTEAVNSVSASVPGHRPDAVELVRLGRPQVVVLATDGVAMDLRNSAGLRGWLAERWAVPVGPYAMGDSLRYRRQGSFDDLTAVVVWCPTPEPQPEQAAEQTAEQTAAVPAAGPGPDLGGDVADPGWNDSIWDVGRPGPVEDTGPAEADGEPGPGESQPSGGAGAEQR